jgi:hypothetical protein
MKVYTFDILWLSLVKSQLQNCRQIPPIILCCTHVDQAVELSGMQECAALGDGTFLDEAKEVKNLCCGWLGCVLKNAKFNASPDIVLLAYSKT